MKQLGVILATAGLLAGCIGQAAPPPPRDHFYRLLVPAPAAAASEAAIFDGVVSVARLDADTLLRERPVLFSASGGAHELQQHDYHFWTDPPPNMVQGQLVSYLRARGIAAAVVTPETRIKPDYEIGGRVKRLERLLGGGPPRVHVEIELALVRRSDGRPIVIDTYVAEIISADASVDASVTAMSAALEEIFERFVGGAVRAQIASAGD